MTVNTVFVTARTVYSYSALSPVCSLYFHLGLISGKTAVYRIDLDMPGVLRTCCLENKCLAIPIFYKKIVFSECERI